MLDIAGRNFPGTTPMPSRFHTRCVASGGISRREWLTLSLVAAVAPSCDRTKKTAPRATGKLLQEGYVWQRVWTRDVARAVRETRGRLDGLAVLTAEVEWSGQQPGLITPEIDHAALKEAACPASLAIRIGPWAGPFDEADIRTKKLLTWVGDTLASARKAGWEPTELQVDFDAATSKLAGYLTWLALIKKVVAPLPVSFTALPDWLNSPLLREMANLTGRYVLQVHAVERARAKTGRPVLIEAAAAKRWVEQAGELAVPFRAALPTYRSVVGFNAEGKIVGIDSEGPSRAWPVGTQAITYFSPAAEIAGLVAEWSKNRPAAMSGVLWYRLPVPGEVRNWTWATLDPVMAGRPPVEKLGIVHAGSNPVDLFLTNSGEAEMPWPNLITVSIMTEAGSLIAADALDGYAVEFDPAVPQKAAFRRLEVEGQIFLPPGGKKPLGWLRFNSDTASNSLSITLH